MSNGREWTRSDPVGVVTRPARGFPPEEDLHPDEAYLALDPFGDSAGPGPFLAQDEDDDCEWERHDGRW